MKQLFENLLKQNYYSEDSILVINVKGDGSVPRGSGAAMLCSHQGRYWGTVGGGSIEFICEQLATECLVAKKGMLKSFRLNDSYNNDLGMLCGGNVDVLFVYFSVGKKTREFCEKGLKYIERNANMAICFQLDAEMPYFIEGTNLENNKFIEEKNGVNVYIEKLQKQINVYIFGGGHIAQALVPLLYQLDFQCIVIDDRNEFANKELFPNSKDVHCIQFTEIENILAIDQNDYICVMTRGHSYDALVQDYALKTPASYIGVVGSIKKRNAVFKQLMDKGHSEEDLIRITTPIGLEIKADTPAEIAVSIAAQLILHRATVLFNR